MVRLCSLIFLFSRLGWRLRHRIQRQLGLGSLELRERVASGRAGVLSRLRILSRLGGRWHRLHWLLSWCRSSATGGGCRAGALRQEVPHCLGRLMPSSKTLHKTLHGRSKQSVGETGESRKGTLSASLILANTTKLAIELPMACAVAFIASWAGSVALHCSLEAAGSGLDLSMAWKSLAWKIWSTAIECRAVATCLAEEYAHPARADVFLHGLEG